MLYDRTMFLLVHRNLKKVKALKNKDLQVTCNKTLKV